MNLRWINRDGKAVLQELKWVTSGPAGFYEWQDVPVVIEKSTNSTPEDLKVNQATPREFWIDKEPCGSMTFRTAYTFENRKSDIHVIEVLPTYKLISRDEIIKSWDRGNLTPEYTSLTVREFLKELGFDE